VAARILEKKIYYYFSYLYLNFFLYIHGSKNEVKKKKNNEKRNNKTSNSFSSQNRKQYYIFFKKNFNTTPLHQKVNLILWSLSLFVYSLRAKNFLSPFLKNGFQATCKILLKEYIISTFLNFSKLKL